MTIYEKVNPFLTVENIRRKLTKLNWLKNPKTLEYYLRLYFSIPELQPSLINVYMDFHATIYNFHDRKKTKKSGYLFNTKSDHNLFRMIRIFIKHTRSNRTFYKLSRLIKIYSDWFGNKYMFHKLLAKSVFLAHRSRYQEFKQNCYYGASYVRVIKELKYRPPRKLDNDPDIFKLYPGGQGYWAALKDYTQNQV